MKFRKKIKDNLFNKKGYSHITSIIGFLILMMCLACFMSVTPVFITKFSLDNYANELIREAEISGIIGTETTDRLERLNDLKGLYPIVSWKVKGTAVSSSSNKKINLGEEVSVTVSKEISVSFFGEWEFTLKSTATGLSEVYWK